MSQCWHLSPGAAHGLRCPPQRGAEKPDSFHTLKSLRPDFFPKKKR